MGPDEGKSHRLTVSIVAHRLRSELEALGFAVARGRHLRLVKKINDQTEVFIYPGVRKRGADILVDPVIGVENIVLREAILASDPRLEPSTRVCHAYLGLLSSWGRFYVRTEQELVDAASQVVKAVVEIGLLIMSAYDTLEKVRRLFREELARTNRVKVAVLFAEDKLKLIEAH
jgi:hypothetical protein